MSVTSPYFVIRSGALSELEKEVNFYLTKGYEPLGGVSIIGTLEYVMYLQPMINYKASKNTKSRANAVDTEDPKLLAIRIQEAEKTEFFQALKAYKDSVISNGGVKNTGFVLPSRLLLSIYETNPQSIHELLTIKGVGDTFIERYGDAILKICRDFASPEVIDPQKEEAKRVTEERESRQTEKAWYALHDIRTEAATVSDVKKDSICSKELISSIYDIAPVSIEELETVPGISKKFVKGFGEKIIAIFNGEA